MEPPPPLPPRSPAEGRRDQPPGRIRPSVLPPAATSTPSLAPSLALRALPLNRSESAKEGGNGGEKSPRPCPARRRPGRRGEERRAAAATGHGPLLGLTVAVRTRQGAEQRRDLCPPQPRLHPGSAYPWASPM